MTARRFFSKDRTRIAAMAAVGLLALAGCQTTQPTPPLRASSETRLNAYIAQAAHAAEENRDYGGAANHYASLYQSSPNDPQVAVDLARNLRYAGRLPEALSVLEETLARLEAQTPVPAPLLAPLLVEQGKAQIAAGHADRALPTLRRAAELAPEDWRAANALGIACDRLGRFDEAAESYRRAQELDPDNVQVLNNFGLSQALAGDLDAGLTLLERAAARADGRNQVRENLTLLRSLKKAP